LLFDATDPLDNNNSVFFHPYGYDSGGYSFFGSRASGGGRYAATSTFHLQQVFTASGPSQPYTFSFVVDAGEVSSTCGDCTGGGTAVLDIIVKLDADNDGTTDQTFTGNASLQVDANGYTFTRSGLAANLDGIPADQSFAGTPPSSLSFTWGATPMALALGSFADGQTFRLDYDLIARATGDFQLPTGSATECFNGDQFNEVAPDGQNPVNVQEKLVPTVAVTEAAGGNFCTSWTPGTVARAGDPGGIPNGTPFGISGAPEPASIALVGLGLGAVLLGGRRRGRAKPG
jgi:hypothetical protein